MDLAIDTNVLLACFKADSITRRMIAADMLHLFTTEYQMSELESYMNEMAAKYSLNKDFVDEIMLFLESRIEIVPKEEYTHLIKKLEGAISDRDDLPLLALATAKNFQIWSNDRHLKEQHEITVFTTSELLSVIQRGML